MTTVTQPGYLGVGVRDPLRMDGYHHRFALHEDPATTCFTAAGKETK